MGTSDMNSTPPAMTVSHWPLATRPIADEAKRSNFNKKLVSMTGMMMFMLTKLKIIIIINQNVSVITCGYESYCDHLAEVPFNVVKYNLT